MKIIPLTKGYEALVDDDKYEELMLHKWTHSKGYAVRRVRYGPRKEGKGRWVYMHHVVLGITDNTQRVDHKNQLSLDNQRHNLRPCNNVQNSMNRPGINIYKGVSKSPKCSTWRVRIKYNGKEIHVGSFKSPELAALAYNEKALELYGEFAHLNIVAVSK